MYRRIKKIQKETCGIILDEAVLFDDRLWGFIKITIYERDPDVFGNEKKDVYRAVLIYSYMYGLVVPFTYQKNLKNHTSVKLEFFFL